MLIFHTSNLRFLLATFRVFVSAPSICLRQTLPCKVGKRIFVLGCAIRSQLARTFLFHVHLLHVSCSFSEDSPFFTGIFLEEGAAGKTDIDAIVVMDGISNAKVSQTHLPSLPSWTLTLFLGGPLNP